MKLIAASAIAFVMGAKAIEPVGDVEAALFEFWKAEYKMEFPEGETDMRMRIFAANHAKIEKHNAGNAGWTMSHNQFSHMTPEEFKAQSTGYHNMPKTFGNNGGPRVDLSPYVTTPDSIDWETNGAVTGVKDQGSCGSCWSFSTTGGLEGAYYIKNQDLQSFSEGMLVDCDTVDDGCSGGLMDNAYGWIQKNGGLCTEEDYAYEPVDGHCKKGCTVVDGSAPTGWTDVATSEDALEAAVALAPVSIAIEADQSSFQFYAGGVMNSTCGTNLDHGVLAVGYGDLDGQAYWRVKNSWGTSWGTDGYILLAKDIEQTGGQCGIHLAASYPQL